jgi:hypothetical protein
MVSPFGASFLFQFIPKRGGKILPGQKKRQVFLLEVWLLAYASKRSDKSDARRFSDDAVAYNAADGWLSTAANDTRLKI